MFIIVEYVGSVAAVLTTAAFFPQVLRTVKTRSTSDMSWSWLIMFSAGVLLWTVYGIGIGSFPVIAANAVTFICVCILLMVKVSVFLQRKKR